MQRTLYDAELPAGARPATREATLAAIVEQFPGADVQLIEHKPPRGPRRYRIVAALPRRRRRRGSK